MTLRRLGVVTALVLVALVAAAGVAVAPALRSALAARVPYANPVLDRDFRDPQVLRASDGSFYAYATQSRDDSGRQINIQVARSEDLATWQYLGEALPQKPPWANETQDFWAPHVSERDGRYVMYYSANPNTEDGLCLAVATASAPAGPFSDRGSPLRCGPEFVNIDPMAFRDPADGRWLLCWGSASEPIRMQLLSADGLDFAPDTQPVDILEPDAIEEYENLVEGAWVVVHEGGYYLFYSGDSCCHDPHYAVLVARSESASGPFEKLGDTAADSSAILEEDREWDAPGHNSVISDAAGRDWLVYHAIDRDRRFAPDGSLSRRMLIDPIDWVDGWPRLLDDTPSSGQQSGPAP